MSSSTSREISCRVTRTLLMYVREANNGSLGYLLDGLALGEEYLLDPNNWVSHSFLQILYNRMIDILGDENAVYKNTYEERKGKNFDLYREHLRNEHYDRKIWMARDPRDVAVSRMLYRWHKGTFGRKKQYQAHLDTVLQKEKDPKSIPFCEICRY